MCEVLKVSRSGFYKWRSRPPSRAAQSNEALLAFLLERARWLKGVPGYRKLHHEAVDAGFTCSRNRVQRLLQRAGYRSAVATKPGHRRPSPGLPVLPNLLNRAFSVARNDTVWVSDITQIRCVDGWLYLAIVIDLYNREVIGWALGRENQAALVLRALRLAWRQRQPEGRGLLFHSDQGCQYRSEQVMRWLSRKHITISMSRPGNCWDNACAESFFALLKKERTHRLGLISRRHMAGEIKDYIDQFYNTVRIHGSLGYQTPAAFGAAP